MTSLGRLAARRVSICAVSLGVGRCALACTKIGGGARNHLRRRIARNISSSPKPCRRRNGTVCGRALSVRVCFTVPGLGSRRLACACHSNRSSGAISGGWQIRASSRPTTGCLATVAATALRRVSAPATSRPCDMERRPRRTAIMAMSAVTRRPHRPARRLRGTSGDGGLCYASATLGTQPAVTPESWGEPRHKSEPFFWPIYGHEMGISTTNLRPHRGISTTNFRPHTGISTTRFRPQRGISTTYYSAPEGHFYNSISANKKLRSL